MNNSGTVLGCPLVSQVLLGLVGPGTQVNDTGTVLGCPSVFQVLLGLVGPGTQQVSPWMYYIVKDKVGQRDLSRQS